MSVWPEGDALDVGIVSDVLTRGGRWTHGPVASVDSVPVGGDFGFSGRVSRLSLALADGRRESLVAKLEGAAEIGREATFRRYNEAMRCSPPTSATSQARMRARRDAAPARARAALAWIDARS